jgi:hypothetical protein
VTTLQALGYIARDSLDLAIYLWPISVALAVAAIAALTVGFPLRDVHLRRKFAIVVVPYAMPIIIMTIGAFLRYDGPPHPQWVEPPEWRGWVLSSALVANIVAVIAVVVVSQGARIRVAAAAVPSIWLSLSSGFVAGVAIAGVGP